MKGPGLFLAQFAGDTHKGLAELAAWAAGLGFRAVQLPTWMPHLFDLSLAAESQDYCDEITGSLATAGLRVSELSTHVQGQLVAVNPVYDELFDGMLPASMRGDPNRRREWAIGQLKFAAAASRRMGLSAHATFSGALAWPFLYPYPQRPAGLIGEAFDELARRWRPILDAFANAGVDLAFEIHPGEDLFDGASFELFLDKVGQHPTCNILYDPSHLLLQQLDYLAFIDTYHERIRAFHVKDAEFRPTGRQGVYGGYAPWIDRAGRFRSAGDGQVDFGSIFSKLAANGYVGWAVLEWECCLKHPEDGAREGAAFIREHMIRLADHAFDDFVGVVAEPGLNRRLLGLDEEGRIP